MAWWAPTNADLRRVLGNKEEYSSEEELGAIPGSFPGPSAFAVKKAFPYLIEGILTDKPWERGAENAIGIGVNNTFWVLDPRSLKKGVWVLNSTSEEASTAARNAGATTQYGYFVRTSSDIPPIAELSAAGLNFGKGFTEAYYSFYPDQDPRPKNKPKTPVVTQPPPRVRTFEVVGMMDGTPVPLTDIVRHVGGSDYELAPGASIAVADAPEDGFNLGGDPGRWNELYPGISPAQFGLDRDKGVLFYNGGTGQGQVLPARVLLDWYGPGWRREIYGAR